MTPDKIVVVHNGALGDFLLVWPGLLTLRRAFPAVPLLWAGRSSRLCWLRDLDCVAADPRTAAAIGALYSTETWPDALGTDTLVVWFGLQRCPAAVRHANLWFIPLVEPSGRPARLVALNALEAYGVPRATDWLETWQRLFGRWSAESADRDTTLLFPGAGHPAKQWPLPKFLELAERLAQRGLKPAFVLGPVEMERGLRELLPPEARVIAPADESALSATLLRAGRVMGNDCGPMHLAGHLRVPGLVLFGPTSARQWRPVSLRSLALALPCRPCTLATAALNCDRPLCLELLDVERVDCALP